MVDFPAIDKHSLWCQICCKPIIVSFHLAPTGSASPLFESVSIFLSWVFFSACWPYLVQYTSELHSFYLIYLTVGFSTLFLLPIVLPNIFLGILVEFIGFYPLTFATTSRSMYRFLCFFFLSFVLRSFTYTDVS